MSTHGQFNTKSPTIKRILKEATELSTHPSPDHHATPLDSNLFEWHFTLRGPPTPSPYANGIYHGRIILPPTYPLRPPSFRFLTPTGRFEVNREICLSISGHHEETWQPAWGIRTALVAIRSFMDSEVKGQLGGLECGESTRRALARESRAWRCAGCGGRSCEEILGERADAARVKAEKEDGKRDGGVVLGMEEVQVPQGLRLAYRDELGRKEGGDTGQGTASASNTATPAAGTHPPGTNALNPPPSQNPSPPPQQPQPTRTTSIPSNSPPVPPSSIRPRRLSQPQQNAQPQPTTPIPAWIDKAILGVALSLAVMLLRKLSYL